MFIQIMYESFLTFKIIHCQDFFLRLCNIIVREIWSCRVLKQKISLMAVPVEKFTNVFLYSDRSNKNIM